MAPAARPLVARCVRAVRALLNLVDKWFHEGIPLGKYVLEGRPNLALRG